MKSYIDRDTFINTFDQYGRSDNFTRAARAALFEYYEQLEEDLGEDIEFDCIAICCDWGEHENWIQWADDYGFDVPDEYDDEEAVDFIYEHLRDNTQIIEFNGGILVQAF